MYRQLSGLIILGVGALTPTGTALAGGPDQRGLTVSVAAVEAHLRFLADDLLEGRGIGTRGGRLATAYVEAVFRGAGLKPAFGTSFVQAVPLIACAIDPAASLRATHGPTSRTFGFGDEFVVTNFSLATGSWKGRPLFMGYGITAPEWSWDDYHGTDVRGRLLVALANEPGRDDPTLFQGPALTAYGRWISKMEEAARRGAVGLLLVHTDRDAGYTWDVVRSHKVGEAFHLADEPVLLPLQGWLSEGTARELLRLAGLDLDDLRARAESRSFKPVEVGAEIELHSRHATRQVEGRNVVAILPGADPTLSARTIVLSAHHDHLGIVEEGATRSIFNGAVDNGSAMAVLLALAQTYGARPQPPRATLVFASVDGEEEGFLGSRYLAAHPPFSLGQTLADITFEMSNVWGPTRDFVALGAEQSSLEDLLKGVLARRGLSISPDPAPDQGFFFRSDQYSFARAGVPAIWLDGGTDYVGHEPGWGATVRADYRQHDYHRPTDTVRPDWDLRGLVQLAEVASELVSAIEDAGHVDWRKDAVRGPR
jgi:Zn-dependent M28 family amino/carboxypeptidase